MPSANDVSPRVKSVALRMVEVAAAWEAGDGGVANAGRRLEAEGYNPNLAVDLEPLLGAGEAAVVQVRVAQYGGILAETASVLIVVDQWSVDANGRVRAGGTTLDVRLRADEPDWIVTTVRPARWGRTSADLTRAARRLLDNDRVRLPYAAASDVRAGAIDDSVLEALTQLAVDRRIDVSILRSGHPIRVFGTDRRSDHTDGRAVDLWALDGRLIIDNGDTPMVADFMRAASASGAYQVGGPVNLDGDGTTYFADDTHRDHIHLGFPAPS
ncbi:MAG: hypothetical protein ABI720_12850 [Actinomycetes bacterium]